jgi:hypothetical protein
MARDVAVFEEASRGINLLAKGEGLAAKGTGKVNEVANKNSHRGESE